MISFFGQIGFWQFPLPMTFLTQFFLRIMEWLVAQCAFFATLETHLFHINGYFKSHNSCEVFPYHFSLRVASLSEWVWSVKGPPQMRMRETEFSVKEQAVTSFLEDQPIFSALILLKLFLYLMLVIIPFWNAPPFLFIHRIFSFVSLPLWTLLYPLFPKFPKMLSSVAVHFQLWPVL